MGFVHAMNRLLPRVTFPLADGLKIDHYAVQMGTDPARVFGFFTLKVFAPTLDPPERDEYYCGYMRDGSGIFRDTRPGSDQAFRWQITYTGSLRYTGPRTQMEWLAYRAHTRNPDPHKLWSLNLH